MEKAINEITLNVIKAKTTMEPVGFCNITLSCKRNIDNVMDAIIVALPEARKTAKKVKTSERCRSPRLNAGIFNKKMPRRYRTGCK